MAAACGYRDMVVYLLEHNADCTLLDVDGNFAYDVTDDLEIQKPLIKYMEFHGKCTCICDWICENRPPCKIGTLETQALERGHVVPDPNLHHCMPRSFSYIVKFDSHQRFRLCAIA